MDQFESSHPLQMNCIDSHFAESLFDDLLYCKGASILKYFHYLVGNEVFMSGLKIYLNKFAFKNANFSDLKIIYLDLFKDSYKQDINPISIIEPYIMKEGMNNLSLV